ncbi:hypothetical protein [Cohnella panacarvi]|uniref:hypothetical protein n=1 Tax=Cohnella panacarvi TaxID=400776 RepID=UPI0004B45EC6|nr:hypothetical protein [Cohnella panacarvi]
MDNYGLPDLSVNGVSDAVGGKYGNVRIDGVIKVVGDIEAQSFKLNGVIRTTGSVKSESFECDGTLKVAGSLSASQMRMNGLVNVEGALSGEWLRLNGLLKIKGDCEFERVEGEGGFDVDGLLNAGSIHLKLQGRGKAREIGVESLYIRQGAKSLWSKVWKWLFPKFNPELQAGVIEGDDIDVEHTKADVIRGSRVVIGKGSVIGRVEYGTELQVHPGATIRERVKTGG